MKEHDDIYDRFIKAARRIPSDERVPYGFENRIMARLRERPSADPLTYWTLGLWRATVPCLALMLFTTAWANFGLSDATSTQAESINTALQLTMTQPLMDLEDAW